MPHDASSPRRPSAASLVVSAELPGPYAARLRAYAAQHQLTLPNAATDLLLFALSEDRLAAMNAHAPLAAEPLYADEK